MFENYDDVVDVNDLCKMLKIGKNKAYELLNAGNIKSIRIGKSYKIPKRYVIDFIQLN